MALFRAVVKGQLFGCAVQNVLHFERADAPANAPLLLAQSLRDFFYSQIKGLCNNAMVWNSINIYDPEHPENLPLVLATNFTGTWSSSVVLWGPLSGVFQIKTAVAGRTGRGRFYIAGMEPAGLTSGLWGTGRINLMNQVATSIKGGYVGSNPSSLFTLGILPRGGSSTDFKPAIDLLARPLPGAQSRRNIGRGI